MTTDRDRDIPSPDRFMERDVRDLHVAVGKFEERINNINENMVTKEQLANSRLGVLQWTLRIIVPIFASALGALAILISNLLIK